MRFTNGITTADSTEMSVPLGYSPERDLRFLRWLIWLYFWFLIFEGALRKWAVPSLSTPLLIIRDPVVLLIYIQAIRCRRFPVNSAMLGYFALVSAFVVMAVVQIISGIGGGPLVALYGLRTNFLHFPLIFVIPRVFSPIDVRRMGKVVLMLAIPMAILMVFQYRAGPGSWLNAATKADAQQLAYTGGKVRPSGTFSFTTGAGHFFMLATAFLVFGLGEKNSTYSRWLLGPALLSWAIVQPVSGSRTLVLGCGLVFVAAAIFALMNPSRAGSILAVFAMIGVAAIALSFSSLVRDAVNTFMARWTEASGSGVEESIVGRFFHEFTEPVAMLPLAGVIGKGIGMGTNAASALLTGALVFLLAEGEWARIVLEVGPLLGFAYLIYRMWLAGTIALRAGWAARQAQLLPWLLAWHACRSMITEQLSQPTNLGFMVLVCGLCLASISRESLNGRSLLRIEITNGSVNSLDRIGALRT